MKILITGISGFVGPHLKHELESADHTVLGVDRKSNTSETLACDLLDAQKTNALFATHPFDFIVHLAALTSVQESYKNPELYKKINVEMTRNIFEALQKTNATAGILITSSSDVYGPQEIFPITENAKPHPQNPYAESKLAQEKVAHEFPQIQSIISRSFNHTGPGASETLVVGAFAKQVALCELSKQKEICVGNLEAKRDFLDVRDVVRAYRLLIEKGTPHEIYNICSGTPRTIQSILDSLLSFSDKKIGVTPDPERMRPADVPEFWGSHEKISSQTSWEPSIQFEKTLKDAYLWWLKKLQNKN